MARKLGVILILLSLLTVWASAASARTIYLDKRATGNGNGLTPENAATSISAIMSIAQSGDLILALGDVNNPVVYYESFSIPSGINNIWFLAWPRLGTVITLEQQAAREGTQSWSSDGTTSTGGHPRYSMSLSQPPFIAYYKDNAGTDWFLPELTCADLNDFFANTCAESGNVPHRGYCHEGSTLRVVLPNNDNANGAEIHLGALGRFSGNLISIPNSDDVRIDGFILEGAEQCVVGSSSSQRTTVRNSELLNCRRAVNIGEDSVIEWNRYYYPGYGQFEVDVHNLNSGITGTKLTWNLVKQYQIEGGGDCTISTIEGSLVEGVTANTDGVEVRYNTIGPSFDGVRLFELRGTDIHHNNFVGSFIDNGIEFESDSGDGGGAVPGASAPFNGHIFRQNFVSTIGFSLLSFQQKNDLGIALLYDNVIWFGADPITDTIAALIKNQSDNSGSRFYFYNNTVFLNEKEIFLANLDPPDLQIYRLRNNIFVSTTNNVDGSGPNDVADNLLVAASDKSWLTSSSSGIYQDYPSPGTANINFVNEGTRDLGITSGSIVDGEGQFISGVTPANPEIGAFHIGESSGQAGVTWPRSADVQHDTNPPSGWGGDLPPSQTCIGITVDDGGGQDHTTIQAAHNAASSGNRICVYPGTYPETVTISKSVKFEAIDLNDKPIIDCANTRANGFLSTGADDDVEIKGFEIKDCTDVAIEQSSSSADNWVISDNTIHHITRRGVSIEGNDALIVDNLIHHVYGTQEAFCVYINGDNNTVITNDLFMCGKAGIRTKGSGDLLTRNRIFGSQGRGVDLNDNNDTDVFNSHIGFTLQAFNPKHTSCTGGQTRIAHNSTYLSFRQSYWINGTNPTITNCVSAQNNIWSGAGYAFLRTQDEGTNLVIEGNRYHTINGRPGLVYDGGTHTDSPTVADCQNPSNTPYCQNASEGDPNYIDADMGNLQPAIPLTSLTLSTIYGNQLGAGALTPQPGSFDLSPIFLTEVSCNKSNCDRAFDLIVDPNLEWTPSASPNPQVVGDAGSSVVATHAILFNSQDNQSSAPNEFIIEGSANSGGPWTVLIDASQPDANEGYLHELNNSTAYRYYRLTLESTHGSGSYTFGDLGLANLSLTGSSNENEGDFYVACGTGDDGRSCAEIKNISTPANTIAKALGCAEGDSVVAGDRINLLNGTCSERIVPGFSGASGNPFVIRNVNGHSPVVDGTGVTIPAFSGLVDTGNRDYIEIRGLTIRDANGEDCLAAGTGEEMVFEDNIVDNCGGSGIAMYNNTVQSNSIIRGNTVTNTTEAGIVLWQNSGGYFLIDGNTVSDIAGVGNFDGIQSNDTHHVIIQNNTIESVSSPGDMLDIGGNTVGTNHHMVVRWNKLRRGTGAADSGFKFNDEPFRLSMYGNELDGIGAEPYEPKTTTDTTIKFFHNTVYNAGQHAMQFWNGDGAFTGVEAVNNAFITASSYLLAHQPNNEEGDTTAIKTRGNVLKFGAQGILWRDTGGETIYPPTQQGIDDWNTDHGQVATLTTQADTALFTDPTATPFADFTLPAGSDLIDAGENLTTANGSGSGTSLVVHDSAYFHDGYGLATGSMIKVGSNPVVEVVGMTDATHTLQLSASITWSNGDPVNLSFAGGAPDAGANESGMGEDTEAPTAATGLSATPNSSIEIALSWTASTDNVGVTGYRVDRCTGSGCSNFVEVAQIGPVVFAINVGLSPGVTYRYRLRAEDAAGNLSAPSNEDEATTFSSGIVSSPIRGGTIRGGTRR